jgi:hypothetical protein
MAASVPYSQLKPKNTYVLPAPSEVKRFTMGAVDSDGAPPQVWIDQRNKLLMRQGYPMTVQSKGVNGTVDVSIVGNIVQTFEAFFPPGQLFKPFVVGVDKIPPQLPPPAPDPSADPWDEFYPKHFSYEKYTDDEYAMMTPEYKLMLLRPEWMQTRYGRPGFRPKIADIFSSNDLAAQTQFFKSFTVGEKYVINDYLHDSYRYTTPWVAWSLFPNGPAPPRDTYDPLDDDEKKDYSNLLFKAPKLTREIEVFRGLRMGETDIESMKKGTVPISTSYDKYTARDYNVAGKGGCCLLRVIVKPGVGVIALDLYRFPDDPEKIDEIYTTSACEILICPPYNVQIEDIGGPTTGLKRVTITPKEAPSAGRRRRKTLRQSKKLTSKFRANKHKSSRNKRDR